MLLLNVKFSEALTKIRDKVTTVIGVARDSLTTFANSGEIEKEFRDIVQHNLDTEGDGRWQELAESTIKRKIRLNQSLKILEATGESKKGALADKGIKVTVEGNNQARVSIEGEPGRIFGYHARAAGNLPERNVFAIPEENRKSLTNRYHDVLDKELANKFRR